jgi:hypothetical protein
MSNQPLCHVGDIVQYDWDKDDNTFLVTGVRHDSLTYYYICISLLNGKEARYHFNMAHFEVLA